MITRCTLAALAAALVTSPALAVFIQVDHQDLDACDFLAVPTLVDELGLPGVFPDDEIVDSQSTFTDKIACPDSYEPLGIPNTLVSITNLTPTAFNNLWYVADPQTRFTNIDGLVNGQVAFKIDATGLNRPLISESGAADGVFAPGETWRFIVDNYSNTLGLPGSALLSPGAVGALSGVDDVSSASVIGTRVPEPAALLTLLVALAVGSVRRRR